MYNEMYILLRRIKHKIIMIFKSKYRDSIYCNYLLFYNMLFHNEIKNLKQMKKILIKMVEKSYNRTIKDNRLTMEIYDKERHDVDIYWNVYFMRNIIQLKDVFDVEHKNLCRQYRKANRKYKDWDDIINKFNKSTESYLAPDNEKNNYLMYIIRILDTKIDIYYNKEKKKLYTKKYIINENVYDKLEKQIRSNKDVR